jgi:flagellar hook protein FlgE
LGQQEFKMAMSAAFLTAYSGMQSSLAMFNSAATALANPATLGYESRPEFASVLQAESIRAGNEASGRSGEQAGQPGDVLPDLKALPANPYMAPAWDALNPPGTMDLLDASAMMLIAQHTFDANARIITTASRMVGTLISLTA